MSWPLRAGGETVPAADWGIIFLLEYSLSTSTTATAFETRCISLDRLERPPHQIVIGQHVR